jgi:hypothetical protein
MDSAATSPKVFISYSHDSDEHKAWVRSLATRLVGHGVYVILDEWDIEPGGDVTAYMERGLASCDRVLIVCTENYIAKANTLTGGVRYERMIITSEIARNLETKKFVPLLRSGNSKELPDFLGTRMYVDFRTGDDLHYDRLLRTLLGVPKHARPPMGKNPYEENSSLSAPAGDFSLENQLEAAGGDLEGKPMEAETNDWKYHWHGGVHRHFGNKLHFILLRFASGSIFLKESILNDLRESRIYDYMIFHLYSHWDLLIRMWADEESIERLKERFASNTDLHRQRRPEFVVVDKLMHWSNGVAYASDDYVEGLCNKPEFLEQCKDVQRRGKQSPYFKKLYDAGVILDNKIRFDEERIQFFITVGSIHPLESAVIRGIERLMGAAAEISNRTVYKTSGSIRTVIKGQVSDFNRIHACLRAVTEELEDRMAEGVVTETMLVASRDKNEATIFDFNRVERYVFNREFEKNFPEASDLSHKEQRYVQQAYMDIRHKLPFDRDGILNVLIRARAAESTEDLGRITVFFASFEELLKDKLVPFLLNVYGKEWQTTLDQIKLLEGISAKDLRTITLGDRFKIYRRIVLDKGVIDIAPLSEAEFSKLMDDVAKQRNKLAHQRPVLGQWDELFSICSLFVPIHDRLTRLLEGLR